MQYSLQYLHDVQHFNPTRLSCKLRVSFTNSACKRRKPFLSVSIKKIKHFSTTCMSIDTLLTWRTSFFAHGDENPSTLVCGLPTTAPTLALPLSPFHSPQFKLHYLHRWHQQSRSSSSRTVTVHGLLDCTLFSCFFYGPAVPAIWFRCHRTWFSW